MHQGYIFWGDHLGYYKEGKNETTNEKERVRKDRGRRSTRYIHKICLYCPLLVISYVISYAIVLNAML